VVCTKATTTNLPPSLYVQSSVTCLEGGSVDINTARIEDSDNSQFLQSKIAVNISIEHGQLYLPIRTGLFFNYGNMVGTDSRFEIIGRLSDIQKALSVIKYLADADFNGEDTLQITAFDMHLQTRPGSDSPKLELRADHAPVTVSTVIVVEPVNDVPVIAASARFLTCDQQQTNSDGTPAVSTASFSAKLSDADVRTPAQMVSSKFQLNLSSRFGTLRSAAITACNAPSYSCTLVGTLDELNAVLEKVTYAPDAGYNKYQGSERIGE
jgi:hypothetical protein